MNLLCPNCQKPLTVPEQYAGQPMRCPLCAGTFTVPALPQPAAAPPAPPPMAPPPSPVAPAGPGEVYGLKDAGAAPPPPPEHNIAFEELAPTSKGPSSFTGSPKPSTPGPTFTDEQPSYPSSPTPEGYHRKYTIWFSPRVLQYVAPVCLFVVFVLTFFAWLGVFPGGVTNVTQSAWQAAGGWYNFDPDIGDPFDKTTAPGVNLLLIFYLLLFIPTFLVTVGCLALVFVPPSRLPPALHPILPWRWGVVAALNLVLLLFLALQMVLGFSLENNLIGAKQAEIAARAKERGHANTTAETRRDAIDEGLTRQQISRTVWLDLVVLFHILAVAAAGLMFCLNRRGGRPAPRIDLLW